LFQNVVFVDQNDAKNTKRARLDLQQCQYCQFVFNVAFDESQMNYSGDYQNEQGYSQRFDDHLNTIVTDFLEKGYRNRKIVEIGCGKGTFINKLRQAGFANITGYDPAFEGSDPDIICDYFKGQSTDEPANLIILRHVLEHIAKPFDFLKTIAHANRFQGTIYIEVPDFHWIVREKAVWDIYNEHCNYFTPQVLSSMFASSECHLSFGDQYLSFFGELNSLQSPVANGSLAFPQNVQNHVNQWKATLENHKHRFVVIWGASSKGVIFANLVDPHAEIIKCLVDINPKKHEKFIGGTGHKIISPSQMKEYHDFPITIIVANKNYLDEIKKEFAIRTLKILTL